MYSFLPSNFSLEYWDSQMLKSSYKLLKFTRRYLHIHASSLIIMDTCDLEYPLITLDKWKNTLFIKDMVWH